jgi:4'-phosphopantetheinyl transferase
MFHHVLVRGGELPSLDQGQAWPGLLSPREEEILAGLLLLPRRRKWLLGRAAAKRLVRERLGREAVAESRISVLNRPSGEPFVLLEGQGEWELPISLSHRSDAGLAAAPERCGWRIGADLETVVPRAPALVRQFFTEREAALVAKSGEARDEVVARIWSAKEAVLKLLGLGLRLDTRAIEVTFDGESYADGPAGFSAIAVGLRAGLLPESLLASLRVVWRREGDCVLTVAVAG